MRTIVRITLIVLVAGLLAAPASLAAGEKNHVRFHLGYFSPTGDYKEAVSEMLDVDGDGTLDPVTIDGKVEYQGALGAGIGYEYMVTDLIGIDFGFDYFSPDLKFQATVTTTPSSTGVPESVAVDVKKSGKVMPLTAGVMFHVYRSDSFDFYLGPQLAYVMYGDVTLVENVLGELKAKFKDELTFGAKLGIDVPFGQGWAFNAQLQYIDAKAELDENVSPKPKFNPKPMILTAGATYKF